MSNKVDDIIAQNNYRLTADKIVQLMAQIRENPSLSAKRWAWELMQNAKDVPNVFGRVSVEIELTRDNRLLFRHNGDPFAMENVTGLVQQVSSKDSQNQEGQTGKFGTGFICTHLLSDVIEVEGVLEYDGFRRFHLQLDRSGERSEDLLPRIQESLETLRKADVCFPVIKDYAPRRKECDFDTVFTYHLTTEEKVDAARAGLNDLLNTLPITLVGQPKIKRVHVINNQEGTDVTYECQSCRIDQNVMRSEVLIDQLHKHFFTYSSQEVALTIEYKLKSDGTIVLLERDDQQPVLYRDFPLIGSERFYFPFTLNGYNFHPTERRNGLLLNTADSSAACKNRNILNHAVAVALEFNQWLIAQGVADRHILAETRIPQPVKDMTIRWQNPGLRICKRRGALTF